MKMLHDAGLVDREKRGVWVFYRVRPRALASLSALIGCPRIAAAPGRSAGQDRAQVPGGKGETGSASGRSQDYRPYEGRHDEGDSKEHGGVDRGHAEASCGPRPSTSPQHPPTTGPTARSLRAALRAGLSRVKAAMITSGSPNSASARRWPRRLGRGPCQIALARLVEAAGQFLDDRRGQLRGQRGQVSADQAGLGHDPPSTAALTIAAKSRQSARRPDRARTPAGSDGSHAAAARRQPNTNR